MHVNTANSMLTKMGFLVKEVEDMRKRANLMEAWTLADKLDALARHMEELREYLRGDDWR